MLAVLSGSVPVSVLLMLTLLTVLVSLLMVSILLLLLVFPSPTPAAFCNESIIEKDAEEEKFVGTTEFIFVDDGSGISLMVVQLVKGVEPNLGEVFFCEAFSGGF